MNKKRLLLGLAVLCFWLVPALALADTWEITSPYGWRFHPLLLEWKFHGGVDFGLDYGTPVPAVQAGTVEYTAYDEGGGNMVLIDHGNGQETVYMHLAAFAVTPGQQVAKRQTLGYVGSTGYSTGPHLHLGYYLNNALQDPLPYLEAQGWTVTNVPATDILDGQPGFASPGDLNWDFSGFYEIGAALDEAIATFAAGCKNGLANLKEEAIYLFWVLAVIDLAWLALRHAVGGSPLAGQVWVGRLLQYGLIFFLLLNWTEIVDEVIASLFSTGMPEFFGGASASGELFSKPGDVVAKGVYVIEPAFTYLSQNAGIAFLSYITYLACMALAFLILLCFVLLGAALVIYNVEFYILAMAAMIALPFGLTGGLFARVKAFPGGIVGALIASAVKILIAGIAITLIINIVAPMQPVAYEFTNYAKILAACCCFLLVLVRVPGHIAGAFRGQVRF
ncbi:MAG: peptidoglycan DD-metalloendopeptidase family protein [Negativicutes bacterium]|nr:peptidoglycan DD-metalloendopeptidase family protein [Negativicutes bacterium]